MPLQIEHKHPDRLSVRLDGPLDRHSVPAIRKGLLKSARAGGVVKMEIDLSRVSNVDTAGIAVLVEVLKVLNRKQGSLRLTGLNGAVLKMIRLSRLETVFDMADHCASGS